MSKKINLVIMGEFAYPNGMAGTRRIQNALDSLKQYSDLTVRVLLQRQSTEHNVLSGVHDGIPYETVMGDLLRVKMFLSLPVLYYRTIAALRRIFLPNCKNIIYYYGPLLLESVVPLTFAKKFGYKIVFDFVEDFDLAKGLSGTVYHYARIKFSRGLASQIRGLATGIVVISSHLEEKYRVLTEGKIPIHYMPITVDMDHFPIKPERMNSTISLHYAGSFGKKDGLPVLLDAFDQLAEKYENIILILTGRGDKEAMKEFYARMEVSPHKDRIEYKGYLEEKDYYSLLIDCDIPCMTRVDHAFAHAGFPFKLGEFLATGRPVIASRVSDVESFLVNRHNAMLVQAGSVTEICEAARFLIDNRDAATTIGMRGREVAESFFDYKKQGEALLTFLEKV